MHNSVNYTRSLLEASLDPLVTISTEGKITDVNEASARVTGRSRGELIGTDFSSCFTEPDKAREGYQRALSEGSVKNHPLAIRHVDGRVTDVLYNASIYRDEQGRVQGVFAAARDITELRRAEGDFRKLTSELERRVQERTRAMVESNERLRLATEAGQIGVWDWDVTTGVVHYDSLMFRIYGVQERVGGLVTYEDWRRSVHPDDLKRLEESIEQEIEEVGHTPLREFRIIRESDRAIRNIRGSEAAIAGENGRTRLLVGVNIDVTESVQQMEMIRNLNSALQVRARELESTMRELDAFSYSVSHDLRAPLRAIDGFSRIVEEDYAAKLDDEGRRVIKVIRSEAQRMGRLIDDLLAFSRLGRQQVVPVMIDMGSMARSVFEELVTSEPGRSIHLDLHPIPPAYGTEAMLRQLWANLIGNAVKFTRNRESAEVEIGVTTGKAGEQVYFIRDNGAGFDMRYADKLFGVFSRLHSETEFPGTGVGLALAKRIVNRHGGRVWGEGEVGKGATFFFTIPNSDNANDRERQPTTSRTP